MSIENADTTKRAYTDDDLRAQIKPLPQNRFARFFVKLYRRWLHVWYGFYDRHEKGAALLQKAFFFLVFSVGVTIWQYVVMTFLPYAFASLNDGAWGWPNLPVKLAGNQPYIIFGDAQGLGYFIAFEIAVFTAQCINFPLQRNVTYRSHGNAWVQAAWYFIGWVSVSALTSALWGICNCFFVNWGVPDAVTGLVKTMITGMLSMVVFFFIFLIIFPDNVKLAKSARARYEKAVANSAPQEKVAKLKEKMQELEHRAEQSTAEQNLEKAKSLASATAMRYFALKQIKGESDEAFQARKQVARDRAILAIEKLAEITA